MKRNMKRVTALVTALLLGVLSLAGCGNTAGETNQTTGDSTQATNKAKTQAANTNGSDTIVWWSWQTQATEAYREIITLFNEQYPNITVDLQMISNSDYWTKLPIAIAGGTGPDLYEMTRPSFELFAASNQMLDITDIITASERLQSNLAAMDPVLVDTYKFNGQQMAVPISVESSAIAYNKDLFKAAGIQDLKEIEDTWTWEDLREIAKQLTVFDSNGEATQYGFMIPVDRLPTWEIIWSHGEEMFNEAKDECTLANPGIAEVLQPIVDMYAIDKVSPSTDSTATMSADDMFMSGRIAMLGAGVWKVPTYAEITGFDWDVAQLPKDSATGERRCSSNILGIIVNPNTAYEENCVKFLEVFSSPEAQKILADKGVYIPANVSVRDSYFAHDIPENIEAYQKALDYVHPNTLTQYIPYSQFTEYYWDALREAYNGTKTLENALQDAEDLINKTMDENKANFE